ncbi:MAG TPA: carboxymuconolactone decarboxylase family protein [Gammaproteobacteria bacterium]|nr:carboxymuconolactone decarboxylase family protein [Gammaproteobacteria bacterium]
MSNRVKEFTEFRQRMNERILSEDNRVIKRVFSVDSLAYQDGVLPAKTKELLGLTASLVLRCDDCVSYHIGQCLETGSTKQEIIEAMSVALVVGGTIVIPHLRRGVDFLDQITGTPSD